MQAANSIRLVGRSPRYQGRAVCAFVDVLGWSDFVLREWGQSGGFPLACWNHARSTIGAMREFEKKARGGIEVRDSATTSVRYVARAWFAGACAVVAAPLRDGVIAIEQWAALMSVVFQVNGFERVMHELGLPVRGGLEIDELFWDRSGVMGPALVRSASIEKEADHARIVVGEAARTLVTGLSRIDDFPFNELPDVFRRCDDLELAICPTLLVSDTTLAKSETALRLRRSQAPEAYRYKYDWLLGVLADGPRSAPLE
jgi:hypothetical protein